LRHIALVGMASLPFATAPVGGGYPVVRLALRGLSTSSLDVCSSVGVLGSLLGCGLVCLQRPAAAGVAWHSPVRCGTASSDGACGICSQRRLGLQRIVAGLFSTAESLRCGTTSDDGAGDFFGLLARWRRLVLGGSSEMIRASVVICSLIWF
jgi:hypothetical protein